MGLFMHVLYGELACMAGDKHTHAFTLALAIPPPPLSHPLCQVIIIVLHLKH